MKPATTISILLALMLPAFPGEASHSETFDSAGVPITYCVEGQGEPVVLIHGLHSSARMNWQRPGTAKLLASRYQVITLDVRGHGSSGKPEGEDAYGVQMMEDVIRLLDHLQIRKAHIVGYSMGGIIALKLIAEHPDRVLSGTLGGMGWLREGSALQKTWETLPNRGNRTPAACVHSISRLAVTEAALKAIRVPVAVLIGDHDPVKGLYVEPLTNVRKDWPVTEIAGAGHLGCIAKDQFKEALQRWLDQNAGKN